MDIIYLLKDSKGTVDDCLKNII